MTPDELLADQWSPPQVVYMRAWNGDTVASAIHSIRYVNIDSLEVLVRTDDLAAESRWVNLPLAWNPASEGQDG